MRISGLTLNELFDASLVVAELDSILVGKNGNHEFTNLPRKFNITITSCVENCTHDESQDVALVPAMRRDRVGIQRFGRRQDGIGRFHDCVITGCIRMDSEGSSACSRTGGYIPRSWAREARSKCRFAFLIEEWGLPRLREELAQRVDHYLEPAGRDVRSQYHSDHLGITPQKQPGYRSVGMCVPMGRLYPNQIDEMAISQKSMGMVRSV